MRSHFSRLVFGAGLPFEGSSQTPQLRTALLRGGRLRKTSRGVFTFAPFLGAVSMVALGALLTMGSGDAWGGTCTEPTANSGTFTCSGSSGSASIDLRDVSTGDMTVTVQSDFVHNVSSGTHALDIDTLAGATNLTVTLDGTIGTTMGIPAVNITHLGSGTATVTLNSGATITAAGGVSATNGLNVSTYASGDNVHNGGAMTITTTGANIGTDMSAIGDVGLNAWQTNDANLTITSGAVHSAAVGISAANSGNNGDIAITTMGDITGGAMADSGDPEESDAGIKASVDPRTSTSGGDITVIVSSGNTVTGNRGIYAFTDDSNNNATNILLDISGTVDSSATNGNSIIMRGGASHTLRLRTGANIMDGVATVDADGTTARTSGGILEIIGTHTFTPPSSFTNINLAPTVSGVTATTTDSLSVMDYTKGGTLTLNVNFTAGTADTLTIGGDVTGTDGEMTTINLVGAGGSLSDLSSAVTLVTFTTAANLDMSEFTAGTVDGSGSFTLGSSGGNLQIMPAGTGTPMPMDMIVADACTEQDATPGRFICAGSITATQSLAAIAGEALIITDHDAGSGFSISTDSGNAFTLTNDTMSTGMSIDIDGDITTTTSGAYAIHATHQGSGEISITTGGTIMATSGTAIRAFTGGSATGMTITNSGSITAGGDTASRVGVSVALSAANGNLEITNSGSITVTNGAAVRALHDGDGGNVTVTNSGSISGSTGISAEISDPNDMNDMGAISVTIGANASVTGTDATNGHAIRMQGGATQRLVLHAGAEFMGTIIANYDRDTTDNIAAMPINATLELSGTGDATLPLAGLAGVDGFTSFEKSGSGTWTFIGNQPMDRVFTQSFATAVISAGTLRLGDGTTATTLRPGTATLTIGAEGTLEAAGMVTITGDVDNSAGGTVSLALADDTGADDSLTVMGNFTGAVTLDADLTGTTNAIDSLVLNGSGANSVTINLRVTGDINNLQPDGLALLSASSTATNVTLTEGTCTIGNRECVFTLDEATGQSLATLAIVGGGAVTAVVENYAASLADIAALSGLASRTANRHYANGNERGFWAQIAAGQTDTTPSFSSTGSSRDTGITRARFGLDAPLPLADLPLENLAIGANFWLAQTDTDITSRNGKGDIETDAFGFAASATLEHSLNAGALYADAQLQHATFSSDLKAEGETVQSNHDATSWGAALELGYKLPPALHGISFTPQAQLTWSSIDFDAFTDTADERISIADGETLTARLGIAAASELPALKGATLRGSLDVLLPLDGETAANLGESRLISDLQDPALSLTAGGIFPLNATTTLAADLATTQSDETETYRASLSARFAF